jgi:hypothetical protein
MKLSLQNQIRFMRGFWGIKSRFAGNCAVRHYLRAPFTLVGANAQQPNFVSFSRFAYVLKIAAPRHLAQIAKPIVSLIAVYVVNMLRRPFARYVSPRKAMRELLSVVYGYRPIARRLSRPSRFADKIRSLFMRGPCKDARIGVVVERRAQMFDCAWWVHCHDNASTIGGLK